VCVLLLCLCVFVQVNECVFSLCLCAFVQVDECFVQVDECVCLLCLCMLFICAHVCNCVECIP
jgi:hypothetical protein